MSQGRWEEKRVSSGSILAPVAVMVVVGPVLAPVAVMVAEGPTPAGERRQWRRPRGVESWAAVGMSERREKPEYGCWETCDLKMGMG
jgi:hypothetical protein